MSLDNHHDIRDPLPQHAADSLFNATLLTLGAAVLGALGIYAVNTLPYVDFANRDRAYWLIQACALAGYGMLSLSAVVSCRATDRFTRRLSLGQRVAMGGVAMAAATGLALVFLVLPMFLFFTGVTWDNPQPMWVLTGMLAAGLYAVVLVQRIRTARRAQTLQVRSEADALEALLAQAERTAEAPITHGARLDNHPIGA